MKVILLGDAHIGTNKSSDIFHNYFSKFYEFLFSVAKRERIKTIIQTGDIFDYRREIHFNTLDKSEKYILSHLEKFNFHVIAGNHDCLYKNTNRVNSVDLLLKGRKGVTTVTMKPQTIELNGATIDLFPWINPTNHDECVKFARESKSEYAVGHFEFALFPMHPGSESLTGMDHTIFSRYKKVFSGHYHTQSKKDNVQYLGTPYELTWIDCDDPKGFWIFDTDTGETEFVKNPYTLFKRFEYHEEEVFDGKKMVCDFTQFKDKHVKIIAANKGDMKKFDSFLIAVNASGPIDVKVIDSNHVEAVSRAVGKQVNTLSTQAVIEAVIDQLDTHLDKSILKRKVLAKHTEALAITNSL